MPQRPLSPCTADPTCPRLVGKPGPCVEHGRQREAERRKRETWRDYGPEFQRSRLIALAAKPLCDCGARSRDVDHIVPLRLGGTHAPSNLDPKCHSCHSKKTAAENRFGGDHT